MNADLIKAIQTMPEPVKDSQSGAFKNHTYASLGSVTHTIKAHLSKYGFSITQTFNGHTLVTSVWADPNAPNGGDGPMLESRLDIDFASGSGPNYWQVVGQGITYLRRYALTAMFCLIAGDADDDAELQTWYNEQQKTEVSPLETSGTVPTGTPSRVL